MKVVLLVALLCVSNVYTSEFVPGIVKIYLSFLLFLQAIGATFGVKTKALHVREKHGRPDFYMKTKKNCFISPARRIIVIRCCGRHSCQNVSKLTSYPKTPTAVG
jgi:hypothetical protein